MPYSYARLGKAQELLEFTPGHLEDKNNLVTLLK
jgi:hypothetical protein